MEIEENHTYYVGEDKLLVHNEYDLKNLVKIYDDYAKGITDSSLKSSFNETLDAIKKSGNEELLKEFDNNLKDIKADNVDDLKNLLGETNGKLGKGFEGVSKANVLKNAGLDKIKVDEIVAIPKGSRPDPSTYLSKEFIDTHLSQFDDGLSVIQTEWAYGRYSETNGFVGVPDDNTLFVMPKKYCDEVVAKANGNISIIEKELGFPIGYFSDGGGLVRIDVDDVTGLNLRLPSGNETGANQLWIPGGYTSGNVPEAITDIIPLDRATISRVNVD